MRVRPAAAGTGSTSVRTAPAEPVVSAKLGSCATAPLARGNGPKRGHSLPLATVALGPPSSQPGDGPAEVVDEHALLRLALWLADVAAEAALAATTPAAAGRADEPPGVESAP